MGKEQGDIERMQYEKYEVDSQKCRLDIGDLLVPETVVGLDRNTGLPVKAGLYGRVATMYFNPMNDSVMVLAVCVGSN